MKKYSAKYIIPVVLLTGLLLTSCSEDTKDVSIVLDVPLVEWTTDNPQYMSLDINATYTDVLPRGVSGGVEVPVEQVGSLPNTSVPGIYRIAYKAYASETFYMTSYRYVAVVDKNDLGPDISGNYANVPYGDPMTITKLAEGFYRASETWWQSSPIPVEFADLGSSNYEVNTYTSTSGFGPFGGDISYNSGIITFDMVFTSGTNAGARWTTNWQKQ